MKIFRCDAGTMERLKRNSYGGYKLEDEEVYQEVYARDYSDAAIVLCKSCLIDEAIVRVTCVETDKARLIRVIIEGEDVLTSTLGEGEWKDCPGGGRLFGHAPFSIYCREKNENEKVKANSKSVNVPEFLETVKKRSEETGIDFETRIG